MAALLSSTRLLVDKTTIVVDEQGSWLLTLVVRQGRGWLGDRLSLRLDRAMHAEPLETSVAEGQRLTSRGSVISLDANLPIKGEVPTLSVSSDLSHVTASLPQLLSSSGALRWTIPFSWVDPLYLPKSVSLEFSVASFGVTHFKQSLIGLNLGTSAGIQANLLSFLATHGEHFYFPGGSDLLLVNYETLSPLVARLQNLPDTTIWGTMWPHELPFWRSTEGIDFLAQQVVAFQSEARRARRIAIDPLANGENTNLAREFLAELEVHHQCGVNIRMFVPSAIDDQLGSGNEALLCIGQTLGVYYRGIQREIDDAKATLVLNDVHMLQAQYDDIQNQGIPWQTFVGRRVLFDQNLHRQYIDKRVRTVQNRARELFLLRSSIGVHGF